MVRGAQANSASKTDGLDGDQVVIKRDQVVIKSDQVVIKSDKMVIKSDQMAIRWQRMATHLPRREPAVIDAAAAEDRRRVAAAVGCRLIG